MTQINNCKKKQKTEKKKLSKKYRIFFVFLSFTTTKNQRQEERITVSGRWTWLKIAISQSVQRTVNLSYTPKVLIFPDEKDALNGTPVSHRSLKVFLHLALGR